MGQHAPSPRGHAARGRGARAQPHGRHRRTKEFAGHRHAKREDHSEIAKRFARESGGPRDYDGAKKVNERKPTASEGETADHIAVDTQGLLLGALVHAASVQDAYGTGNLFRRTKPLHCWLQIVFADSIYIRVAALLACFLLGLTLLITHRIPSTKGSIVLPRRWVVERKFGWLGPWRRLSKDCEHLPEVPEAMVCLMAHGTVHPNRKRLPAP